MLQSFQNLVLLQNLYRLQALGFEYINHFEINTTQNDHQVTDIHELHKNIKSCHLCDLNKSRTQSMCGYGSVDAELMIIDFSVSQIQDSTNEHYAGRSGEVLKNMIQNVLELDLGCVYITHAVKCKTLHSNKPSASKYDTCKSYLFSEIEFVKPKVIVTLGQDAYAHLTSDFQEFENVRGHMIDFQDKKLIPIYHPQYLLRNPESKKIALGDLKTIKSCL